MAWSSRRWSASGAATSPSPTMVGDLSSVAARGSPTGAPAPVSVKTASGRRSLTLAVATAMATAAAATAATVLASGGGGASVGPPGRLWASTPPGAPLSGVTPPSLETPSVALGDAAPPHGRSAVDELPPARALRPPLPLSAIYRLPLDTPPAATETAKAHRG
eukprot:TRINITY_DN20408_c0_g1_i1.p2 TRINITY_DN20408_c0_g1~~TRINITY_DN20408_c0_g1_i1.p2  ORF type:complete len:163 (-),score=18.72 TRINITY_DN20408_c0_g1_i1:3-491(-)